MSNYTKGPWQVTEPNGEGNGLRIGSAGPWPFLPAAWLGSWCWSDEQKANAVLIAAAPDLLEALELADAALAGANMDMTVVEKRVKVAIAKAKGDA